MVGLVREQLVAEVRRQVDGAAAGVGLGVGHVEPAVGEVDVAPPERGQLRRPEPAEVMVAINSPVLPGRVDHGADLVELEPRPTRLPSLQPPTLAPTARMHSSIFETRCVPCSGSPQGSRWSRVLDPVDAKGEHDVPDAADDREGRHPGDQQRRAATVVAGCPEAERDLDDAAEQLQPPD